MKGQDMVALVAGASIGVGGGMLAALLARAVGGEAARRVLDQFGGQSIELRHPARHPAWPHATEGVSATRQTADERLVLQETRH